jgi:hypothetical protein
MPYHFRKILGQVVITQPPFTQTLGPWIRKVDSHRVTSQRVEANLLSELVRQLPSFRYFHQNCHHSMTNWLPFYWLGFQQTTRYTYRLPVLTSLESLSEGLKKNIVSDIRKAVNTNRIKIREDLSFDDFLALNIKTFQRQGLKLPYKLADARSLDRACLANNARKIFIAEDEQGRHHAGVYLVWDEESAYYLLGGGDPTLRGSGATSLCIYQAIRFSASVTQSFDFEGSMIESIERFFQAFGAIQTPYFSIRKTPSLLLRCGLYARQLARSQGFMGL